MTKETKKIKAVWIKPPARHNINSAQDETWKGVTPVANTGTNINTNSKVYSYYTENAPPAKVVSNRDVPTTLAQNNKQQQNTDRLQNESK